VRRIISKIKNEIITATVVKIAKFLLNFLEVCIVSTPARKKSPTPSNIFPLNAGMIGKVTTTGRFKLMAVVAAEIIVPVTRTNITSKTVSATENTVVLQVSKLVRYREINMVKITQNTN